MEKHNPVLLITGASGGIGKATALLFASRGYRVYGLSRSPYDSGPVQHIPADVTKPDTVAAAVEQVLSREGRIDLLICNAGFGISGPVEFTSLESAHRQFDVNFFGAMTCIQTVLPHMRQQGYGRILCVSSVAAVLSIPFQSFYSAAKAALNALVLALANEVRPHNIQVAALMPGDIHRRPGKNPGGRPGIPRLDPLRGPDGTGRGQRHGPRRYRPAALSAQPQGTP